MVEAWSGFRNAIYTFIISVICSKSGMQYEQSKLKQDNVQFIVKYELYCLITKKHYR